MSDSPCIGDGTEVDVDGTHSKNATNKATGLNRAPDLAGDDAKTLRVDKSSRWGPESPHGTKRRLSGETTDNHDATNRTGEKNLKLSKNPDDDSKEIADGGDVNSKSSTRISADKSRSANADNRRPAEPATAGGSQKNSQEVVTIEISDDSSDSSICAVDSYQASAAELKRIRGDDYSSSSDYSSDSSSSCDDASVVLGAATRVRSQTARRAQLNPRAPRTEEPQLGKALREPNTVDKLSAHWAQGQPLEEGGVTLLCEPFKMCLLHDVLSNPEIINNIVDDMNTLDWSRKKMDLYEFHQTTDLANLTWQRSIRGIYDLLKNEIMPWISRVTGLTLSRASASCSLYGPGDHLLVHDDLLADRRVAFILYLAPWALPARAANGDRAPPPHHEEQGGWTSAMGGALELLACDDEKQPTEVVRSVLPRNNMLAFFQVTPESFHQVSEVRSLEFPRLSINGWFHGPDVGDTAPEPPPHPPPVASLPHKEVALLSAWLTTQYMAPRTRLQIQQQMEKASEISLQQFLVQDKYEAVLERLAAPETEWEAAGPANQRRYDLLRQAPLEPLERSHPLRELLRLFTSTNMLKFLHDCTELTLKSHFHLEMQRWRANSFSVLPPKESYAQNQLDAVMYLAFPARPVYGGVTTYVAPEDADAVPLVSLEPKSNALNLVYADAQTARFTKHVSAMTMGPDECFYILTCSYKEELP